MIHQIWHGGNRMGARDLWTSQGQGYWPNSAPSATDNYAYGVSGHYSDGRTFHMERHLDPDEEGDEALLSYLTRAATPLAVGDSLNVALVPRGSKLESMAILLRSMPAGLTLQPTLVKLSDNSESPIGSTLSVAQVSANPITMTSVPLSPIMDQTDNTNYVLALKATVVPVGGAVDWASLDMHITLVGHDSHSGHPPLDVSMPRVTT